MSSFAAKRVIGVVISPAFLASMTGTGVKSISNAKNTLERNSYDAIVFAVAHEEFKSWDHSYCCDLCHENNIIYVGDILEKPLPFIRTLDLDKYIDVLKWIKNLEVDKIITAHSGIVKEQLIDETIEYLKNLKIDKELSFEDELKNSYHKSNLKFLKNN
mgnify:CR=1 FL=1